MAGPSAGASQAGVESSRMVADSRQEPADAQSFREHPLAFAPHSHEHWCVPVRADGVPGGARPGAAGVPRRSRDLRDAASRGGAPKTAESCTQDGGRVPGAPGRSAGPIHPAGPER